MEANHPASLHLAEHQAQLLLLQGGALGPQQLQETTQGHLEEVGGLGGGAKGGGGGGLPGPCPWGPGLASKP